MHLDGVKSLVKKILRHEGVTRASLSIVFVSSQKIRALNQKFLSRNYATDVLAFDFQDWGGVTMPGTDEPVFDLEGEVIISTDAALKYIRVHAGVLSQEMALYIIHGILHLLGFDDHTSADVVAMRAKEQQLLKACARTIPGILSA